jgi:hypothetical protein
MKVFLLHHNSWAVREDYGDDVLGVFSTQEKAIEAMAKHFGGPLPLDFNDSTEPQSKDGIFFYYYIEEREVDKVDAG